MKLAAYSGRSIGDVHLTQRTRWGRGRRGELTAAQVAVFARALCEALCEVTAPLGRSGEIDGTHRGYGPTWAIWRD